MSPQIPAPLAVRGYPVKRRTLAVAGRNYHLLGPANFEQLIDDPVVAARFAEDEFLPYWAEFWPAALLLAEQIASWPPVTSDPPPGVLEIGCGLGLPTLVALARGYAVVASDYDADALAFVAESARLNGLAPPALRFVDWRLRYDELRFDRIVAAEILYERRSLAAIAEFIRYHLRPAGEALIVDNNRPTADEFPALARAAGLCVRVEALELRDGDGAPLRGRASRLTHAEPKECRT